MIVAKQVALHLGIATFQNTANFNFGFEFDRDFATHQATQHASQCLCQQVCFLILLEHSKTG